MGILIFWYFPIYTIYIDSNRLLLELWFYLLFATAAGIATFSNIVVRNGLQFQAMIIIIIIFLFIIKEAGCQAMIDLVDRMAEQ